MEAKRTLVKSPPELWAELSDLPALARHLGEFGEIRITRTEPETVVEWEGDLASGSVLLEPSGWGTKVTLTSEPTAQEPEPEPVVEEAPPDPEPVAAEPDPVATQPPRPGRFARLMWWRRAPAPVEAAPVEPVAVEPEPEPEPAPEPEPSPPPLDDERTAAILNGVLDTLGAAHHRPFSR
jgi:hypothetical protein